MTTEKNRRKQKSCNWQQSKFMTKTTVTATKKKRSKGFRKNENTHKFKCKTITRPIIIKYKPKGENAYWEEENEYWEERGRGIEK